MLRQTETEKIICETMLEMMQHKPYLEIKVTDLVKKANISRSTFYIYFSSIIDVLQKIEDDFIDGFPYESQASLADYSIGNGEKLIDSLRYIKKNMYVYRTIIGENGDPKFQNKLVERQLLFFNRLNKAYAGKYSSDELELICANISGGKWNMLKWWAFHEDKISIERMASLINNINSQISSLF